MKAKALLAAATALTLTACVSAVAWKSVIVGAELTSPSLPVVTDASGNSYQLFPVGTQLYLRKLDGSGVELWQRGVDINLANSVTSPKLQTNATGISVAYQDADNKLAFLKHYDDSGTELWSTDFGSHSSETLNDINANDDGSLTVALKLSTTQTNVLRYDNTGMLLWEAAVPKCGSACLPSMSVNGLGYTMVNTAELFATKSHLFDSSGTLLWSKSKSTVVTLAGAQSSNITHTDNIFASSNPTNSWMYDLTGTLTWSLTGGTKAGIVFDDAGNYYVPNGTKISKFDSVGVLLWEVVLFENTQTEQLTINQIEWREDLQRLVVLTFFLNFKELSLSVDTNNQLLIFDTAGVQKGKYKSAVAKYTNLNCNSIITCAALLWTIKPTTPGEVWSNFATTANKKIVVSALTEGSKRFLKAYKLP